VPTTGILNRPAITRCCCSTGKETVWRASCGRGTYIAPRTGRKCFCQKSGANRNNLETPSRAVVRFYNKRGTAEQWIKEGKQAVKMTRLSCHRFRPNQVRLALSLLAYNLWNLWRRLALPRRIENWSLASLQQRLVKTGGRLVQHARYYWLLLAEGHLNRRRFGAMLGRIALLPLRTG